MNTYHPKLIQTADGRAIVERANFEHLCQTLNATVYMLPGSRMRVCFRHPTMPGIDCAFLAYRCDYLSGQFTTAYDDRASGVILPLRCCEPYGVWFVDGGQHEKAWFTVHADMHLTGKGSRNGLLRHLLGQLVYDILVHWNH